LREEELLDSESEKEWSVSTAMFTVVQVGIEVHGYDCGGNGPAVSVSSWAQASASSGLLAAMCHERFDP